jgi:SAM-dependent methyltransferase
MSRRRQRGKTSRELGLELAALCGTYFFKLENLHYGYWTLDLSIDLANLNKAQEQYTDFLISHIPDEVDTILDVGSGTGHIAKRLMDVGYSVVDCVNPSHFLSEQVRSLLGDRAKLFECTFERLKTDRKYDLILFSESFQYISMDKALENITDLLNAGGYLLICDYFKLVPPQDALRQSAACPEQGRRVEGADNGENSVMGGGHKLKKFHDLVAHYPLELVKDIDITPQTAPNLDLFDAAMKNVAAPAFEASLDYLNSRYKLMAKFLRWKYRKQIERVYAKYFDGKRSAEDFRKYRTYRFLLYKKSHPHFTSINTVDSHKKPALCCSTR